MRKLITAASDRVTSDTSDKKVVYLPNIVILHKTSQTNYAAVQRL